MYSMTGRVRGILVAVLWFTIFQAQSACYSQNASLARTPYAAYRAHSDDMAYAGCAANTVACFDCRIKSVTAGSGVLISPVGIVTVSGSPQMDILDDKTRELLGVLPPGRVKIGSHGLRAAQIPNLICTIESVTGPKGQPVPVEDVLGKLAVYRDKGLMPRAVLHGFKVKKLVGKTKVITTDGFAIVSTQYVGYGQIREIELMPPNDICLIAQGGMKIFMKVTAATDDFSAQPSGQRSICKR